MPRLADALQEATGQGPCPDAAYPHETVRVRQHARLVRPIATRQLSAR